MAGSVVDNLSACHLIGSMVACTLYSAYVFAFGASIYFLFNVRGRRVKPNQIILAVSVIIFICVTVQWCIHNAYIYAAFVVHGDTANGALLLFSGNSTLQVAQLYVYSVTIALLDSVLVYRMYIVWGRNWSLVILPCSCIAAYMTFATILLQTSIQFSQALSNPAHFIEALHKAKALRNEIIIAFSLSLVANFFCTAMIILRILWNTRAVKRAGSRSFTRPAIHLLLESAAVCCACLVITLATFLLNNSGTYFTLAVTPMIVGLSYSAIIIRVGLGIAERGNGSSSPVTSSLRFARRPRKPAQASTLANSVNQQVSVNGGGAGARSDDPEIALELVDDLNANMHGAKLGRPWEAPPWHPRLRDRPSAS